MHTIFANNQSGAQAFAGDLNVPEVLQVSRIMLHVSSTLRKRCQAITLHPIKVPERMLRVHAFLRQQKAADIRFRQVQLGREVRTAGMLLTSITGDAQWAVKAHSDPCMFVDLAR
jgi:hypothetical protein